MVYSHGRTSVIKYNMNDNPKNNILMSENIRQKRLTNLIFSDSKMLFFGISFILYVLQLSGRNSFWAFFSVIKYQEKSLLIIGKGTEIWKVFRMLQIKYLSKCPYVQKPPLPWKIFGYAPAWDSFELNMWNLIFMIWKYSAFFSKLST